MKTIGHVLRDYRQQKQLSVAELARCTAVPVDFIEALEAEDLTRLPAQALVRGYVRLMAPEIGLPEENVLALFRRDLAYREIDMVGKKARRRPRWHWVITPRILSLLALILVALVGGGGLIWQWRQLGQPPPLTVTSPHNYETVATPFSVVGKTSSNTALTINTEAVSLDPQGRFAYELDLPPGERTVVIQATDRRGRVAETIIFLTVE